MYGRLTHVASTCLDWCQSLRSRASSRFYGLSVDECLTGAEVGMTADFRQTLPVFIHMCCAKVFQTDSVDIVAMSNLAVIF